MITNKGGRLQVFTFDKETEKKAGTLTMSIFTFCLVISLIIYMVIVDVGLSLGGYLLSEMTSISIANGAINDQLEIVNVCIMIAGCILCILVPTYGVQALRQLLYAYALLEDGRLIKMKWKLRRVKSMQARVIAGGIAKATSVSRTSARDAVNGIYAFLDGLDMMHNPLVIVNHLNGSAVNKNIISMPMDSVTVVKRTRKKVVILADMLVKNKIKRKKITIYWMYNNMDALCQLCEGGCSVVNR